MLVPIRLLFGALALTGGSLLVASEVQIAKVDFDLVTAEGGRDPWYEIVVEVSVEEGEDATDGHPRFADAITVSLALATEVNRGGGRSYTFYSARVEYPALEVGQQLARFYLPPEIVKRDRVRGEPFAFEIELLSPEGPQASLVSRNLETPGALRAFRSQVAASGAGLGVLRHQYQTPFAWSYPRETPTPGLESQ